MSTEKKDPSQDGTKMRLFSIAWFKFAWGAFRCKNYTPRDFAVDGVSTARTHVGTAAVVGVNMKFPALWPWLCKAFGAISTAVAAFFSVVKGAIMGTV